MFKLIIEQDGKAVEELEAQAVLDLVNAEIDNDFNPYVMKFSGDGLITLEKYVLRSYLMKKAKDAGLIKSGS